MVSSVSALSDLKIIERGEIGRKCLILLITCSLTYALSTILIALYYKSKHNEISDSNGRHHGSEKGFEGVQ